MTYYFPILTHLLIYEKGDPMKTENYIPVKRGVMSIIQLRMQSNICFAKRHIQPMPYTNIEDQSQWKAKG